MTIISQRSLRLIAFANLAGWLISGIALVI